ncbi:MAG: hypothetical protein Q7S83_01730 [bacterium]|nr:hypothetical protein [bacterium]
MAIWTSCAQGLKSAYYRLKKSYLELAMVRDGFSFTLCAGLFAGLAAVFIDIDHLPMLWGGPDRVLHTPLCILAVCVAIYCSARIGRLLVGVVLENRRNKKRGRRHESLR